MQKDWGEAKAVHESPSPEVGAIRELQHACRASSITTFEDNTIEGADYQKNNFPTALEIAALLSYKTLARLQPSNISQSVLHAPQSL